MFAKNIKDIVSYRDSSKDVIDFAVKMAERLTSALYLVSDLIPPSEPLKTLLRNKGLIILSDIFSCTAPIKKDAKENVFLMVLTNIEETNAFLRIARTSGVVSEMNANILQKEYLNLSSFLESRRDYFCYSGTEVVFGNHFFEKDNMLSIDNFGTVKSKGHDKRHTIDKGQAEKKLLNNENRGFIAIKKQGTEKVEKALDTQTKENVIQEERKETIVQLIKDTNSDVNIKDISNRISGCSEKTLQRDLIYLVQKGILKKNGERRWSRYSLVS
ncbi:MAG: hypothetical protein HYT28_02585 [Parcubacteria group bacterium]|nr:hypothetical protein [Parcubacteria group bacterium]